MSKNNDKVTTITCPRCKKHLLIQTMFLKWEAYKCPECLPTEYSCGINVPSYFSPEKVLKKEAVQGLLF
jgi:hypothetical protein